MSLLKKLFGGSKKVEGAQTVDRMGKPFRMTVEGTFVIEIENRGTVATGTIESGIVKVDDILHLVKASGARQKVAVRDIEMFGKSDVRKASIGDQVGLLLPGLQKDDVQPGDVLQS